MDKRKVTRTAGRNGLVYFIDSETGDRLGWASIAKDGYATVSPFQGKSHTGETEAAIAAVAEERGWEIESPVDIDAFAADVAASVTHSPGCPCKRCELREAFGLAVVAAVPLWAIAMAAVAVVRHWAVA